MNQHLETRNHIKKSKLGDYEEKDQISSLPDEILSHMLSFMPTKYAVRTSLLSPRWKSLWTLVPSIELYSGPGGDDKDASCRFMDFVDRILLLHNLQTINKFHLFFICEHCNPYRLNSWICTAIKLNVKELDLYFRTDIVVDLPRNLFTSVNLLVLKLVHDVSFGFPMPVFLPSLKVLHLESLICLDDDSFKNLLSGCPILEELDIKRSDRDHIKTLYISSSTLKRICIQNCYCRERYSQYGIVIKTTALEIFELTGPVFKDFDVDELPFLVRAHFDVDFQDWDSEVSNFYYNELVGMLGKISNIQNLRLSGSIFEAVIQASANNVLLFHNLTHLQMYMVDTRLSILIDLLRHMFNLKVLLFSKNNLLCSSCCSCLWHPVPERVPECLLHCLETIEFSGFKGCKEEMKLVRYLLVNSKVLKKLTLESRTRNKKIRTNVQRFPRGSSTCQIEFRYYNYAFSTSPLVWWL